MTAMPPFEPCPGHPYQVLPKGIYPCSDSELREQFVEAFPRSQTRSTVHDGLVRWRGAVLGEGIGVTHWLDGSFVEDKPDPGDFDVVSFVDYKQFLGLSEPCQQRIEGLLGGRQATKPAYHAHTIMVQACAPDHPYYRVYRKARDYWKDEAFGQVWLVDATTGRRTPSGVPKGFLEITTGPAAPVVLPETEVTR